MSERIIANVEITEEEAGTKNKLTFDNGITFTFGDCNMKKVYLQEANHRKTKYFPFKGRLNKWEKCKRKDIKIVGQSIIYKGNADRIQAVYLT